MGSTSNCFVFLKIIFKYLSFIFEKGMKEKLWQPRTQTQYRSTEQTKNHIWTRTRLKFNRRSGFSEGISMFRAVHESVLLRLLKCLNTVNQHLYTCVQMAPTGSLLSYFCCIRITTTYNITAKLFYFIKSITVTWWNIEMLPWLQQARLNCQLTIYQRAFCGHWQ